LPDAPPFDACLSASVQRAGRSASEDCPDTKLNKEDVPCGNYLWISTKTGTKFLYYFFGSTEWGKGKVGFYQQTLYHVAVNADKEPPTVQRIKDAEGGVTEIRIQMTARELSASGACLSER
jgi:hypothetical protein